MKKSKKNVFIGLLAMAVIGGGAFVLENPAKVTYGAGSWTPSGVKTAQYQLSGAMTKAWTTIPVATVTSTAGHDITINTPGVTYMAISTEDNAGNTNIEMQIVVVGEEATSISPIKTIEYQLTGATSKDWTLYNAPFQITKEGLTTINVRVQDEAGNSGTLTRQVKLDKSAPINNGVSITLN
jgi:hypothetical protein